MSSLDDILSALKNGVIAINNLNATMGQIFPGATTVSTSALTTLTSSNITGSLSIISASGATYKLALYST